MQFYLGTHRPSWLGRTGVPLFVSHRTLPKRNYVGDPGEPFRLMPWALDSGGFSELSMYGEWRTTPAEYIAAVRRYTEMGSGLRWVAPQDWMCERAILAKTGLTVAEHQRRTVENFLELRQSLYDLVIPVLQGFDHDDYLRCVELYENAGVDLKTERIVGVGTVCRRQDTESAAHIITTLASLGLRLHGFGVKIGGLMRFGDSLASADSMAWSFRARRSEPLPGHSHKSCANCLEYALRWRKKVLASLDVPRQLRLGAA